MHFVCTCYDVWMWDAYLSGKINPWLLLRNYWEVESRIIVGDEEYTYLQTWLKECFRWGISLECQLLSGRIQASQFAEDEEVNCYLVGSRLHGNLPGKNKLTISSSANCEAWIRPDNIWHSRDIPQRKHPLNKVWRYAYSSSPTAIRDSSSQISSAVVRDLFSRTNMHPTFMHHSTYIWNTFSTIPFILWISCIHLRLTNPCSHR